MDCKEISAASQKSSRLLVVDDNRDSVDTLKILLEMMGHEVRTAYDGASALRVAKEWLPEAIVCDIRLPGMDGYEVARAIREDPDLSSCVLVALSGLVRSEDLERSKQCGFDRHIQKPADPETILSACIR